MIKYLIYRSDYGIIPNHARLVEIIEDMVSEHEGDEYNILERITYKEFVQASNLYFKTGRLQRTLTSVLEDVESSSIESDSFEYTQISLSLEELSPENWEKESSEMPYAIRVKGLSSYTDTASFFLGTEIVFLGAEIVLPKFNHNESSYRVASQALDLYFSSGKITSELDCLIRKLNTLAREECFTFETRNRLLTSSVETRVKETPQATKPKSIFF